MIIEFGGSNFCSFKEGFSVSFDLGPNCPPDIKKEHSSEKHSNISNLLCVKGANSSGKTSLLKFLSFINDFTTDSFQQKPEDGIQVHNYFFNKNPTYIYIIFIDNIHDITYKYEAEITKKEILYEKISQKKKRFNCLLERKGNEIVGGSLDLRERISHIKFRNNASIISTLHQYEIDTIFPIYQQLRMIVSNVTAYGLSSELANVETTSKFLYNNEDTLDFVTKIIKKFDGFLSTITIEKNEINGEEKYFPLFIYETPDGEKKLTFEFQSSGTKSLYKMLVFYKLILNYGGILVLDEFDINLHPDILPFLLSLFNRSSNEFNAQMIFSTHNTDILDFMGKYRTYLVNKENGESYIYRLDELPSGIIRNDRSIAKLYKDKKLGGIPQFTWDIEDI